MSLIQTEPSSRRFTLSLHRSHAGRGKCSQPWGRRRRWRGVATM